ncbi:alpha/beta fold hydrolase [Saccharothrix coeruleofusca]|uniref:AB hydrolase-1 domain-containing protein n=1 Tax=Saccharothrix coeruleofusca TaxID=33919 RepID=A0A918EDN8_9PSEU|nr:alpha/beta fold hydrolase [Saccharothrix coeruleofusca]GGP45888.1 hypothetical protein GCM10010185_16880 [Saccharothrix coeruleofusca]
MHTLRERYVQGDDLRLRVVEQGHPDAPTVVLVHGYPDTSALWDEVAARLEGNFHVVRYDTRGSGGSEAPAARRGYRLDHLTSDLRRVVEATAQPPVHLVGHDWGSCQGWHAVERHPELFASFTSISGPSLGHIADWLHRNRRHPLRVLNEVRHSWYIAGFLLPVLPELLWRLTQRRRTRELVNGLELYRANVGRAPAPIRTATRVHQIELTGDPFVKIGYLEAAEPWAPNLTRSRLDAKHWAPVTHPDEVADRISRVALMRI